MIKKTVINDNHFTTTDMAEVSNFLKDLNIKDLHKLFINRTGGTFKIKVIHRRVEDEQDSSGK